MTCTIAGHMAQMEHCGHGVGRERAVAKTWGRKQENCVPNETSSLHLTCCLALRRCLACGRSGTTLHRPNHTRPHFGTELMPLGRMPGASCPGRQHWENLPGDFFQSKFLGQYSRGNPSAPGTAPRDRQRRGRSTALATICSGVHSSLRAL
jgi:hypothetical protein